MAVFCGIVIVLGSWMASCSPKAIEKYSDAGREPKMSPDYSGTVIPPNIAPLNFRILEDGRAYFLTVRCDGGRPINIFSKTGRMRIPVRQWRALLEANQGRDVFFDVYVRDADRQWKRFLPVANRIAQEDIDRTLVFRFMKPAYNWWKDIGIYQRDLTNYDMSVVLHGRSFGGGCLNCHSFVGNDPDTMTIALRSATYGSHTLVAHTGAVEKIGAKWGYTGRLPYDMFRYPLIPEALLLTHEARQSDFTQWKLSDIFLELGHVNMAQKLASELVTTKGHLGVALEELGRIGIIKGHPDTARVYLNALKRDPIHHGRAEPLLRSLDSGFTPDQAAYIDGIRSCMRDEGAGVTGRESVDETLAALLEHNPRNKMAFEYLMACYLLTGRVDKIAENVERLHDLGYQKIPTLYEEAILIHFGSQGQQVDLTRFNISQETLARYEAFVRIANAMQTQNRQAVLNVLIRDFGASYFFYYTFGRVGLA